MLSLFTTPRSKEEADAAFRVEIDALRGAFPCGDQAAQQRAHASLLQLQANRRAKEAGDPVDYAQHEHVAEPMRTILNSISPAVQP